MAAKKKDPKGHSETEISKSIAEAMQLLGFTVIRIQSGIIKSGNRFIHLAPRGVPDRICLGKNGLTLWFEVKKPEGELSEAQVEWHEKHKTMGHHIFTVHSVTEAINHAKLLMN